MRIRLIGHSGFYVELEEMNLLFDYYRGELPAPDTDKPLFVFVSHAHPDHFQKSIFSLAERADNVVYFLSDDIRRSALPLWAMSDCARRRPRPSSAVSCVTPRAENRDRRPF